MRWRQYTAIGLAQSRLVKFDIHVLFSCCMSGDKLNLRSTFDALIIRRCHKISALLQWQWHSFGVQSTWNTKRGLEMECKHHYIECRQSFCHSRHRICISHTHDMMITWPLQIISITDLRTSTYYRPISICNNPCVIAVDTKVNSWRWFRIQTENEHMRW